VIGVVRRLHCEAGLGGIEVGRRLDGEILAVRECKCGDDRAILQFANLEMKKFEV